jgi:N-acetylneuraminic acid mutarotase
MYRYLVLVLFFSRCLSAQTWSQLADLPGTERDDGVSKTINNKAYFGTGLRNGFTLGNDFYCLDLSTNTWTTIAAMPNGAERQYAAAFTYSNYLFVHGGSGTGSLLSDTYRYDVTSNTWTTVASRPGTAVMGAGSFTINNKAYLFSGKFSNNVVSDEVWEYDMTSDTWTQKNNFPFGGRWRSSAAALNNNGYVLFGRDNNGSIRKEIYKYTPDTDTWIKITDFPQPKGRYYAGMQDAGNKLVVFGGIDTLDNYYNDCWYFVDISNTFSAGPSLPALGRKGGMCCSSGNKFYYGCGITSTNTRLKETWVLDVPVGIKEYSRKFDFSVYPDPSNGLVYVCSSNKNIKYHIQICDFTGKMLLEKFADQPLNENIDLSVFSKGIYLIKFVSDNNAIETRKIILE